MEKQCDETKPLLEPATPRWWRVLPFLVLVMIIANIDGLILNDFIEYRYAHKFQLNSSSTQNAHELCLNATRSSHNSSSMIATTTSKYPVSTTLSPDEQIQASTARLNVYLSLASTIPAVIMSILLGSNCDQIGRKPLIVLPFFGKIIRYAMLIATAYFNLSDLWIILSVMFDSLSGTAALSILSSFAYVSDCTTEKTRTSATIITDVCIASCRVIPLLTFGFYLQHPRFIQSMVFTLLLSFIAFILAIFLQPESIVHVQHLNVFQQLKLVRLRPIINTFRVFFVKREGHKQRSVLLLVGSHSTIMIMVCANTAMYYIYLYGAPFCLDSFGVSLISTAQTAFAILLTIPCTLFITNRTDHLILPIIGCLSYMAQLTLFGIANKVWMIYVAVCVGALYSIFVPVIRSRVTKLVEPSEYAMVFIFTLIVESGGYYAIAAVANEIYQISITYLPGLVFFVFAGVGIVPILMLTYVSKIFELKI